MSTLCFSTRQFPFTLDLCPAWKTPIFPNRPPLLFGSWLPLLSYPPFPAFLPLFSIIAYAIVIYSIFPCILLFAMVPFFSYLPFSNFQPCFFKSLSFLSFLPWTRQFFFISPIVTPAVHFFFFVSYRCVFFLYELFRFALKSTHREGSLFCPSCSPFYSSPWSPRPQVESVFSSPPNFMGFCQAMSVFAHTVSFFTLSPNLPPPFSPHLPALPGFRIIKYTVLLLLFFCLFHFSSLFLLASEVFLFKCFLSVDYFSSSFFVFL